MTTQEKRPHNLIANLRALMAQHPQLRTQAAVGKAAGVPQSTICKLLAGKHSPNLDLIVRLATAFEVDAWHLLRPGAIATPSAGTPNRGKHG